MRTSSWPGTPGIIFGGDYNPEQWPRHVWDEDVELMRKAGVNLVSIGIFSWSVIQPTEHTWDFVWLDEVFELLHQNGISIDLGTGTASPPPWLTVKHPEILLVNELGDTVWPGARQHWRPTSPVYRKYAKTLLERLAHRYGSHPALVAWHVNNELGCQNHFDFSDDATVAFRRFLGAKYSDDISALNSAWETAFWSQRYSHFDEILPPRTVARGTFPNPGQVLDWRRFSSDALLQYYIFERDLLRAITPKIPITTNLIIMGKQTKDRNYAEWVNELDFVSNDHYVFQSEHGRDEQSFSASLTSGVSSRQPWFLMEHSTSAVQWQRVNTPKAPNELLRDSLTHLAHGADGICFFQWRQSKGGAETYHSSMIPHAGPDSRLFRNVCELGQTLKQLGDIKGSEKARGQVAILFDWESWWVAEAKAQPSQIVEYKQEALDWFVACLDLGIRADIIPTTSVSDLAHYPLVIAPMLHVVSDHLAADISGYVSVNGGHFVTTYWSGITDEQVHMRLGGYPGAFRELLGIRVEELAPIANPVRLSDGSEGSVWSDPIDIVGDNVEVLRTYVDGLFPGGPAITRHAVGNGSAAYVGTKINRKGLCSVLGDLLDRASVESELPIDLRGKVENVVRTSGKTRWEFAINRTDDELDISLLGSYSVLGTGGAEEGKLAPRGIRCVGNEDQRTPCQRCSKFGLTCDYSRKKRGRKAAAETSFTASPDPCPPIQRPAQFIAPIPASNVATRAVVSPSGPSRLVAQSLDLTHYLDPPHADDQLHGDRQDVNVSPAGPAEPIGNFNDDPISLGMLSMGEAEHLVTRFLSHINPVMALLDEQLSTLAYMRQTSTLLLTAVLAASAKFFHRSLRQNLLMHAQTILGRALIVGECNIAVMQALIILSSWKEATDRSSWVKLGTAIRLGYQLGLHVHRREPLPSDDKEARLVADSERTWIVLSCLDRTYADIFSLPTAMRLEDVADPQQWARDTAHIHYGDSRHACSMDSATTYLLWIRYRSMKQELDASSRTTLLKSIYQQFERHMKQWFPDDTTSGLFSSTEQVILKWFDINHLLKILDQLLETCPDHEQPETKRNFVRIAEDFASQTELLAATGHLTYLLDTSATHLSAFGTMVRKACTSTLFQQDGADLQIYAKVDDSGQRSLATIVQRLYRLCDTIANGDPEAVTAYVARFMSRLLRAITTETQSQTRAATPALGGNVDAMSIQPTWLTDMSDFIRSTELETTAPWDQSIDDQFWANMGWFNETG